MALVNIAFALSFILRGAWPVAPFMGLDVALLAWAFRASRKAAQRSERVTLSPFRLRIEQNPIKGPARETEFNPYWVRVDLQRSGPNTEPAVAAVRSHGRSVQVGAFLAPSVRESFAHALKNALNAAKTQRF